jgi:hypothetical protein
MRFLAPLPNATERLRLALASNYQCSGGRKKNVSGKPETSPSGKDLGCVPGNLAHGVANPKNGIGAEAAPDTGVKSFHARLPG